MRLYAAAAISCLMASVWSAPDAGRTVKPVDRLPLAAPPVQNEKYPADAKRSNYVENAPAPVPTAAESEARMLLFSRPLTEPVWAETRPLPYERVTGLEGWGARNQFVTLNFAVYPLKALKNLKVRVQGCAVQPEIRLVCYWDVVYPYYNSFLSDPKNKQFRRMPEFLAPVSVCDAPAGEPQRFLLTFKLPDNGTKELRGDVLIFHDDFGQALKLPFRIAVLPFELKQDPNKHYSACNYQVRTRGNWFYEKYKNNPELLHKAQLGEFIRMREYGFTRPPTFYLEIGKLPDGTADAYRIPFLPEFTAELREAGFPVNAPITVPGSSAGRIYEKFTGHKLNNFHMDNIDCSKITPELYAYIGQALDKYLAYAKKNNYPPLIYLPIDEPSPATLPYVKGVYRIFKSRGLTTMMTSPPASFKDADQLFDIYNYGSFSVPYEVAVSGKKKEYWCYPNDNTYQIKDPYVMCHGGRMTYGLGYWRSGFHCILPWIWRDNNPNRVCNSGGNMLRDDGSLMLTTYWECFRLGVDDLRYIYTLQDAVVRRENSRDPKVQEAVCRAKELLQRMWNATCPQPAYLSDNLIPHAELDAWRALAAGMIMELKKFPESSNRISPSVIIDPQGSYAARPELTAGPGFITYDFKKWQPIAKELTLKELPNGVDVTIKVDHKSVGEGYSGKVVYPIGWPRIRAVFDGRTGMDFTKFTYIEFDLTVSSDRNIQYDYNWMLLCAARSISGKSTEFRFCSTLEPGVKHRIRIPISRFAPMGRAALRSVHFIQLTAPEANYPDGSTLRLKFENLRAVGFSAPTIVKTDAPAMAALPVAGISVPATVGGLADGVKAKMVCELLDGQGRCVQSTVGEVVDGHGFCGFPGEGLRPGNYTINLKLAGDKPGTFVSEFRSPLRLFNAPSAN